MPVAREELSAHMDNARADIKAALEVIAVETRSESKPQRTIGWFDDEETKGPTGPTNRLCTPFVHHTKNMMLKAAELSYNIYWEDKFRALLPKEKLRMITLVVDGDYGLDFAITHPEPGGDNVPYIVFMGTEGLEDWRINFTDDEVPADLITPAPAEAGDLKVHEGYLLQWKAARGVVRKYILWWINQGMDRIVVTGHSLGGAVAQLAAVDLQHKYPDLVVEVITFGAPKPCNDAYAAFAASVLGGRVTRFQNSGDIVPCVSPSYSDKMPGGVYYDSDLWKWTPQDVKTCAADIWDVALEHHLMPEYIQHIREQC